MFFSGNFFLKETKINVQTSVVLNVLKAKTKATKEKLQAGILWILRDQRWHPEGEIVMLLHLCIREEEALAYREVCLAAKGRAMSTNCLLEAEMSCGQNQLIRDAIEGLIATDRCK